MSKAHGRYTNFLAQLNHVGLNLVASFNIDELPDTVKDAVPKEIQTLYKSLLLVGSKGGEFWQYLQSINDIEGHTFNNNSLRLTNKFLHNAYAGIKTLCLYPSTQYTLPLQKLGHLAGWGRPSILGLDIHREYGTWFAYRTALLVSESLPQTKWSATDLVCEMCIEKPCQPVCPVGAVQSLGSFKLNTCGDYRLEDKSGCANICLARLACPVGQEYRYTNQQLTHHGSFSLASIKRYRESNKW
jgi:hypothetical protein